MLSAGCIWIYKWLSTHTHYIRYINLQEHDKVLGQNKIHEEGKSAFFLCVLLLVAAFCRLLSTISDVLLNFGQLLDFLRVAHLVYMGVCAIIVKSVINATIKQ